MTNVFTAIGNACTDIVATIDESFLLQHNLRKGLCGHASNIQEIEELKKLLPPYQIFPGGAGANVAHVISALGGEAHFISKIAADPEGVNFAANMTEIGVQFHFPPPSPPESGSTQVLALITPDGERTFVSFDGAARTMGIDDYDINLLQRSTYLYFDGYSYCSKATGDSFIKAAMIAKDAGCHTTFNVGDLSIYEENQDTIDTLLSICDSVMCNRTEAEAFFGCGPTKELADKIAARYTFGAITDAADGAYVFHDGITLHIPAEDISDLTSIDANGAGDHFSGGFIYGLMNNLTLQQSGHLGALCAKDCLSHAGARPLGGANSLKHLVLAAKS